APLPARRSRRILGVVALAPYPAEPLATANVAVAVLVTLWRDQFIAESLVIPLARGSAPQTGRRRGAHISPRKAWADRDTLHGLSARTALRRHWHSGPESTSAGHARQPIALGARRELSSERSTSAA